MAPRDFPPTDAELIQRAEEVTDDTDAEPAESLGAGLRTRGLLYVGGALLLFAGAGAARATRGQEAPAAPLSREQKTFARQTQKRDLTMTLAKPEREQCSNIDEDCYATGCCNVAGMTCYETTAGKAECMKGCVPSDEKSCYMPQPIMDKILVDARQFAPSMFCFAYAMQKVGTPKKGLVYEELALLHGQWAKQIGIFACEKWAAFTDIESEVGPGVPAIKIDDVDGDFYFAKRKETGTYVNTGHFHQVWRTIRDMGEYKFATWIVKVDADAVFVPSRLAPMLETQLIPENGIYLENCRYVKYGWFGNLEIFSQVAFQTLLDNIDSCKAELPWKIGVENGKWGPMGEDLFAQVCLDKRGVRRGEGFQLSTDGACEADRPEGHKKDKKWKPSCVDKNTPQYHPLMKPEDFFNCYNATVEKFGYDAPEIIPNANA